jgi:hypothetical protein
MKFYFRLLLYSAVLFAVYQLTKDVVPPPFRYPPAPYLIVFFAALMAVFHWWLSRPLKTDRSIVTRYLGATTAKFLLCLGVLAVYVLAFRGQAVAFTLHFLALYLCYTVFEVAVLYRRFKGAATAPPHG